MLPLLLNRYFEDRLYEEEKLPGLWNDMVVYRITRKLQQNPSITNKWLHQRKNLQDEYEKLYCIPTIVKWIPKLKIYHSGDRCYLDDRNTSILV